MGGGQVGHGPPWEEQQQSRRKGIKEEPKRDIPMSLPKQRRKTDETHDFPSNNLGEANRRMQKVISSLTYLVVQSAMRVLTKRTVETFNAIISYEEKDLNNHQGNQY